MLWGCFVPPHLTSSLLLAVCGEQGRGARRGTCRPGRPVGEGTAWGACGGWCVARQ